MLRMEGVTVAIAGVQVLRSVSLGLTSGKTTILIGRNGAGKTTTLRAIMGLLPVEAGAVRLGDQEIGATPAYQRAGQGIGYAPEDRRHVPEFTVEDNILLPALALSLPAVERSRRLDEVYALLPQLHTMRKRPGGGVSGGQGKMVALGRALMVARTALLLDEPFQGLAPVLANRYAAALRALRDSHPDIALLITESNPSLLRNFAGRAYAIERGEVSETQLAESSLAAAGLH